MSYTLATDVAAAYAEVLPRVRVALQSQGFGVLSEIDLAATLKEKLDVDLPPQVILGACRPSLAHQALQADPSVAGLLPCNVVVRALDDHSTRVEAIDPDAMMSVADDDVLRAVAADAKTRLNAALASLTEEE